MRLAEGEAVRETVRAGQGYANKAAQKPVTVHDGASEDVTEAEKSQEDDGVWVSSPTLREK